MDELDPSDELLDRFEDVTMLAVNAPKSGTVPSEEEAAVGLNSS